MSAVGIYRGGFLDWGDRRVWVLAPPRTAAHPIPVGQLVQGDARARASAAIRGGGWAVLSQALAAAHHLRIGERFTLPSPRPTRVPRGGAEHEPRLATGRDHPQRGGLRARVGQHRRERLPGPARAGRLAGSGARARSSGRWGRTPGWSRKQPPADAPANYATTRQALSRLSQIGTLVLIAAVLAMAGAMGSMIWQRRPQLAYIKRQGYKRGVLWRALLCESALLLGAGCSLGALFGIYGQLLLSHALASVTGFPIVFSVGGLVGDLRASRSSAPPRWRSSRFPAILRYVCVRQLSAPPSRRAPDASPKPARALNDRPSARSLAPGRSRWPVRRHARELLWGLRAVSREVRRLARAGARASPTTALRADALRSLHASAQAPTARRSSGRSRRAQPQPAAPAGGLRGDGGLPGQRERARRTGRHGERHSAARRAQRGARSRRARLAPTTATTPGARTAATCARSSRPAASAAHELPCYGHVRARAIRAATLARVLGLNHEPDPRRARRGAARVGAAGGSRLGGACMVRVHGGGERLADGARAARAGRREGA